MFDALAINKIFTVHMNNGTNRSTTDRKTKIYSEE